MPLWIEATVTHFMSVMPLITVLPLVSLYGQGLLPFVHFMTAAQRELTLASLDKSLDDFPPEVQTCT